MPVDYTEASKYFEAINRYPKRLRGLSMGDSWFQYPLRNYGDVQRKVALHYKNDILFFDDSFPGRDATDIEHVLHRVEPIAEDMADQGKPFDLILLSMGGNDVIGKDFSDHTKKADAPGDSTQWQWNAAIPEVAKRYLLLGKLGKTFDDILASYQQVIDLRDRYAKKAWIITHTYADVTPINRVYKFAGIKLAGPWLWKPMRDVGLTDKAEQRQLARWLLESFANLLASIPDKRFKVLDSRQELPDFEGWWDNEIHPLGNGFKFIVDKYWLPAIDKALGL